MAFTCSPCHKKSYGTSGNSQHFSGSIGPCESCKTRAWTFDCQCYKYIDDDRDYIIAPSPENAFLGYKCPYNQCKIIKEDHDFCRSVKQRLEAIAEKKMPYPEDDFLTMFRFNWSQFKRKSPNWEIS